MAESSGSAGYRRSTGMERNRVFLGFTSFLDVFVLPHPALHLARFSDLNLSLRPATCNLRFATCDILVPSFPSAAYNASLFFLCFAFATCLIMY
ncbi:hypothetical protein QC762_0046060 [Podospora pseudocomata]|uniref:Uncharacterized protein n=1 Tax=Podospora pseudocomata TaxID=2093779 RepID=A0ABR0GP80_9PEZI|nr:hypothetical protein QC762_0046060 [Podospora pseudocomata]